VISSVRLELSPNIAQTGIGFVSFILKNPFTATIKLFKVTSTITYEKLTIGKIGHVDLTSIPMCANGYSQVTSPKLQFKFNLDPLTIVQFLCSGAKNNDIDLGPLIELFRIVEQNPKFHTHVR
jgi:hypothetical protein